MLEKFDDTTKLLFFWILVACLILYVVKHEVDKREAHVVEHCLKQTESSKHTFIHDKYYCMNKRGDWVKLEEQP